MLKNLPKDLLIKELPTTELVESAKKFLKKYLNSVGPVGFEYELGSQKLWMENIAQYANEVEIDNYGTAYGVMGNMDSDFKVVIEAHADEISWLVNYIDSKGFIRVIRN